MLGIYFDQSFIFESVTIVTDCVHKPWHTERGREICHAARSILYNVSTLHWWQIHEINLVDRRTVDRCDAWHARGTGREHEEKRQRPWPAPPPMPPPLPGARPGPAGLTTAHVYTPAAAIRCIAWFSVDGRAVNDTYGSREWKKLNKLACFSNLTCAS